MTTFCYNIGFYDRHRSTRDLAEAVLSALSRRGVRADEPDWSQLDPLSDATTPQLGVGLDGAVRGLRHSCRPERLGLDLHEWDGEPLPRYPVVTVEVSDPAEHDMLETPRDLARTRKVYLGVIDCFSALVADVRPVYAGVGWDYLSCVPPLDELRSHDGVHLPADLWIRQDALTAEGWRRLLAEPAWSTPREHAGGQLWLLSHLAWLAEVRTDGERPPAKPRKLTGPGAVRPADDVDVASLRRVLRHHATC